MDRRLTLAPLLVGLLLILGLAAPSALAQSDRQDIRTLLEQRDRELKQAIRPLIDNPDRATPAQKERVQDLINELLNFREMSRRILGPYWADLSPARRTEFVEVFSAIVRAQSLGDLEAYNAPVTYEEIRVAGDTAFVRTRTTYRDKPADIVYHLGRTDGQWFAHDIVVDEVGTVDGYARSFRSVIRKKGFDALMTSLRKKRDEVTASA